MGLGDDGLCGEGSSRTGATEQPTRLPTIAANIPPERIRLIPRNGNLRMALILLEALLALAVFVVIVWWTMFSGRIKGELPPPEKSDADDKAP
jgi:hypothetical protein